MSKLTYVFVHGLSGWGSYDDAYRRMPYWGMRGGDLIAYLRGRGYDAYAASVAPTGSAWDRACELYAQLAGRRVDYGAAHVATMRHERYGKDFGGRALIPNWNEHSRLVLIGHSFGGVTARLLAELLAHGSEDERAAASGEEASELFAGGLQGRVFSVVTLAAPTNGTTAYDLFADASFDANRIKVPVWSRIAARMMGAGTKPRRDERDPRDFADFDMHIDNALALNARIATLPGTYYFSLPCSYTRQTTNKTFVPRDGIEPLFVQRSYQMGAYVGRTAAGVELGPEWRENDGLVNTYSAMAPLGAPAQMLDRTDIRPGIWNVLPTMRGDHMWPQGGLTHKHDIRPFYEGLMSLIASLA